MAQFVAIEVDVSSADGQINKGGSGIFSLGNATYLYLYLYIICRIQPTLCLCHMIVDPGSSSTGHTCTP